MAERQARVHGAVGIAGTVVEHVHEALKELIKIILMRNGNQKE